jgi:hypothetical protein
MATISGAIGTPRGLRPQRAPAAHPRRSAGLVDFVEVDEVRVGSLYPAPRRTPELAGEDGESRRNGDLPVVDAARSTRHTENASARPVAGLPTEYRSPAGTLSVLSNRTRKHSP